MPQALTRRALTATEVITSLAKLEGWRLSGDGAAVAIEKTFALADYYQTPAVANALAVIAFAAMHLFGHGGHGRHGGPGGGGRQRGGAEGEKNEAKGRVVSTKWPLAQIVGGITAERVAMACGAPARRQSPSVVGGGSTSCTGSPPIRSNAASASSMVATGMISTSFPTTSRA